MQNSDGSSGLAGVVMILALLCAALTFILGLALGNGLAF
jgi:hypothetical protein